MAGISYVFTISRVAEMLGEDEEWLDEISIVLDPEKREILVQNFISSRPPSSDFWRYPLSHAPESLRCPTRFPLPAGE
jgi:hypothetical protein